MSFGVLLGTAVAYFVVGIEQVYHKNYAIGGMFICYGMANLFLLGTLK